MARYSKSGNLRKFCGCAGWKTCAHPWFLDFRPERGRRVRRNLDTIAGEHLDFKRAKQEAQRAMVVIRDRRDPCELQREDEPTLEQILEKYGERPNGAPLDRFQRGRIVKTAVNGRPFGDWRAVEITREMVEAFRGQRPTVAGNRDLALLRAAFAWSVLAGLVPSTPFKVGTVSAVKLAREEPRTRRLQPGEEERLLLNAKGLRDLIIAALETGCRLGELLSLQWDQVRGDLFLPAGKTKAKKPRRVPVSSTLRTVLDARRNDPAGEPLPPDAFVLGDEVGRRRWSIRTAWRLTCERAKIKGLHFHDLRREAGSRWMDAGVPLHRIQAWLGHANVSQTSTYLAATGGGDADAMRAFEERIGRLPNMAQSASADGIQATASNAPESEKTQQNQTVH